MLRLIKENWLWIVVPIVLVLGLLVAFLLLTENDGSAPFDYPIF